MWKFNSYKDGILNQWRKEKLFNELCWGSHTEKN